VWNAQNFLYCVLRAPRVEIFPRTTWAYNIIKHESNARVCIYINIRVCVVFVCVLPIHKTLAAATGKGPRRVFIHTRLCIRRKRVKTTVAPNFFPHTPPSPPPPPPPFYSRASDLFNADSSSKHRPYAHHCCIFALASYYTYTSVLSRGGWFSVRILISQTDFRTLFSLFTVLVNIVDGDGRVIETRVYDAIVNNTNDRANSFCFLLCFMCFNTFAFLGLTVFVWLLYV